MLSFSVNKEDKILVLCRCCVCVCVCVCVCGAGAQTQGHSHARQALYPVRTMTFSIKVFVTLLDNLRIPQVAILGDLHV
jgi:hypothetical protein